MIHGLHKLLKPVAMKFSNDMVHLMHDHETEVKQCMQWSVQCTVNSLDVNEVEMFCALYVFSAFWDFLKKNYVLNKY